MGPGRVYWWVPGIAPPGPTRLPIPRVHLPYPHTELATLLTLDHVLNVVVGLKSVAQLTLGAHFSDIRTITEVYNLVRIVRINNHSFISGKE